MTAFYLCSRYSRRLRQHLLPAHADERGGLEARARIHVRVRRDAA